MNESTSPPPPHFLFTYNRMIRINKLSIIENIYKFERKVLLLKKWITIFKKVTNAGYVCHLIRRCV